jgi:hypothetical protein
LSPADPIFGREREIRDLLYLFTAERIVPLHSPSRAGKSSLINAQNGLLDHMRRRLGMPAPISFDVLEGCGWIRRASSKSRANGRMAAAVEWLLDQPSHLFFTASEGRSRWTTNSWRLTEWMGRAGATCFRR